MARKSCNYVTAAVEVSWRLTDTFSVIPPRVRDHRKQSFSHSTHVMGYLSHSVNVIWVIPPLVMRLGHTPGGCCPGKFVNGVSVPPLDNGHERRGPLTQVPDKFCQGVWDLRCLKRHVNSCFESLNCDSGICLITDSLNLVVIVC